MGIIRLTLLTVAGIGGAMLWFGRDEGLPQDRLGYTPRPPEVEATVPAPSPSPAPNATAASAPATVPAPQPTEPEGPAEPATPAPAPLPVAAPAPAPEPAPPASATASLPVLYVTGSRVNMRAAPSTRDGIVASLVRGTAVERLGDAAPGWAEIRVVETGAEGFMASRFLSPERP